MKECGSTTLSESVGVVISNLVAEPLILKSIAGVCAFAIAVSLALFYKMRSSSNVQLRGTIRAVIVSQLSL